MNLTALLFAYGTVPVVAGSQSTRAFLDIADAIGDFAVGSAPAITYETGALALDEDDAITVDGQPYLVRQVEAIGDGALTVARLKRV